MSKANRSKSVLSRVVIEAIENRLLLAGDLDPTFAGGGYTNLLIGGPSVNTWEQTVQVMGVQNNGANKEKIIIGGENHDSVSTSSQYLLTLARTNPDGSLDTTFSSELGTLNDGPGILSFDPNPSVNQQDTLVGLAIDSNDNIYVAGNFYGGFTGGFVMKISAEGVVDTTFGVKTVPTLETLNAITLAGGSLYLAGSIGGVNGTDIAITKLDLNGNMDTTFGGNGLDYTFDNEGNVTSSFTVPGVSIYNLDTGNDDPTSILVQSNGNIVVGGIASDENFNKSWIIGRFGPSGAPDSTFGVNGDGFVIAFSGVENNPLSFEITNNLYSLIDVNGTIVAGGSWMDNDVLFSSLAVVSQNGSIGPRYSFNPENYLNSTICNMAFDSVNNKIVVAGSALGLGGYDRDIVVARFSPTLDLDTGMGIRTYGHDVKDDVVEFYAGVTVQESSRIVVGTYNYHFEIGMYGILGTGENDNQAPVITPFEDMSINEGEEVTINGIFSVSNNDSYEAVWSYTINGTAYTEIGDSLTIAPTDNNAFTISLTVTDTINHLFDTKSFILTVNNVAPTVSISGPATAAIFTPSQYNVTVTDPGLLDNPSLAWTITNASSAVVASGTNTPINFTPTEPGDYILSVTATDKELDATTVTQPITVSAMVVIDNQLIVGSGNSSNTLILSSSNGQISVYLDGQTSYFSGLNQITLYCGAGNDRVIINPFLGVSCDVFGGDGNDILSAGSGGDMLVGGAGVDLLLGMGGADILVGGDGNDLISGGNGNDLIIGGHGADLLLGNSDQDILVAGITSHDNDPVALKAILAEWASPKTYTQRVQNITNGTGTPTRLNGDYFLAVDVTVFDDAARDSLAGNSGTDFFIFNADYNSGVRDLLIDRSYAESAFDVDDIA